MKRLSLVLMVLLAVVVATPVQGLQPGFGTLIDNMDNIALRPWMDYRSPGEGTGLLHQNTKVYKGTGSMGIDYGVTNDSAGVPDPTSGYDYLGNFVGVGGCGGAFDSAGNYKGKYDREIGGFLAPGELPDLTPLVATHAFSLEVYKHLAGYSDHVRELQLYDSTGARNTYSVQPEATADQTCQGWTRYEVPLSSPLTSAANLADIVEIRLWVTAWSAYVFQNFENPQWPDDYMLVPKSGKPVKIDDLRLIPEPATIAMLSLGGLALLRRRKKA